MDGHRDRSFLGRALASLPLGPASLRGLRHALAPLLAVAVAGAGALMTVDDLPALVRWALLALVAATAGATTFELARRERRLARRLDDAVRSDSLTGLLNRRAARESLEAELARSRRSGRPLSAVEIQVHGVRELRDRGGQDAVDRALRAIARDLEKWKRRADVAARVGRGSFALVLPETDERGAYLVAERMRRASHLTFADAPVPLSLSLGVVTHPAHGEDADALLHASHRAVLAAKELGADRVVIYSVEVDRILGASEEDEGGELQLATVIGLAEALDIRDTGTTQHSRTVGRYAELMAVELGLPAEHVERVRIAGLLHDVGKVGVSDELLTKPGPLDDDEWSEIRTHPQIAARLLAGTRFDDVGAWIEAHHERPDGKGYPHGLKGEEIPLEARIIAVADAYEAMTAERVYRPALGARAARAELIAGAGTQFDRVVVSAFLRALDRNAQGAEQGTGSSA
jgi:diguanylate cyclase (GGDEF)-like protein/putative nucleotidyltransferase with HDIG domain